MTYTAHGRDVLEIFARARDATRQGKKKRKRREEKKKKGKIKENGKKVWKLMVELVRRCALVRSHV